MSNIILMTVGFLLFLLSAIIYLCSDNKASDGDEKSVQIATRMLYLGIIASIIFLIGLLNSIPVLSGYSFEQVRIIYGISFCSAVAIAICGGVALIFLSDLKISAYKKLLYVAAFIIMFSYSVVFTGKAYTEYNGTEYTYSEIVSVEYSVDETNGPTYEIKTADGNTYDTVEDSIIVANTSEGISYMEVESYLHLSNDGSKKIAKVTNHQASLVA